MEVDASQIIPDIGQHQTDTWFSQLEKVVSQKKPKLLARYPDAKGGSLFTTGDDTNGYYYLVEDEKNFYFVRYRMIKANGNRFGRQVLVARKESSVRSTGIALYVFYKYLLPRFGALLTDTQQTLLGKRFWSYALHQAFVQNFHVYCLDRKSTPNILIPIKDAESLDRKSYLIGGSSTGHLRTHAVISMKAIALKVKP